MKENDLLQYCRYYKGQKENPYKEQNDRLFWEYEKYWINAMLNKSETQLSEYINDYLREGYKDFEKFDDTPMTLKALLLNRFDHWMPGGNFKEFYKKQYYKK